MAISTMLRFPLASSSIAVFRNWTKRSIISSITQQSSGYSSVGKSKRLVNFLKKDGIPDNFDLVYRNPATRYIQVAQVFSLVAGIAYSTALLYMAMTDLVIIKEGYGPSSLTQLAVASTSLIATCVLLQVICYKSPLRIYSDTKKFILFAHGPLGQLTPRTIEFVAGSCVKAPPGMLSVFRDSRFRINGKIYLIFEDHFKSNADYNRMMGL